METETNTQLTTPSSGKSDESISKYVDIRVGPEVMWPKLLPTHPRSMATNHNIMEILKDIKIILNEHGIAAGLCCNVTFRQYPGGSPPILKHGTILEIPCRGGEESRLDALERIHFRLSLDKLQFRVGLVDWGVSQPSNVHTILPDNPIVALWASQYREEILTAIRETQWQSVNVFHCGQSSDRDQCPITLMINAWDARESYWWDSIIPVLALSWPYHIRIRLAQRLGTVSRDAGPRNCGSKTLNNPSFDMGSRIELRESCGGTLGGAIDLQCPGGTISRLGLTTYQIARHNSIFYAILRPRTSRQARRHADQKSPLASSSSSASSSSDSDTCSSITASHSSNQNSNDARTEDQNPLGLRALIRSPSKATTKRDSILKWLEDLETHKHETMQIRQLSLEFVAMMPSPQTHGIAATLGPYNWLLDWSLLKPRSPNHHLKNIIPNTSPHSKIHQLQGEETTTHYQPTTSLGDLLVSKRGGTTGWTDGKVNSIPAELNITQKSMYEKDISYSYGQRVSVWVGHGFPSEKFCMAGDAGGFVLDSRTGDVVGFLVASDQETGDGYFVPFDVVVRDIEMVTGGKVVNPTVRDAGR